MILNKIGFGIALLFMSGLAGAQVNRYMVFFKDKNGTSFTTLNPAAYLSQKAIDRRTQQHLTVTDLDLPVSEDYVQNVRNATASTFFKTRWMNGVLIQCNASLLPAIQALNCVKSIELVAPGTKLLGGRLASEFKEKEISATGTSTASQLKMLGMDHMHDNGIHGEGITIAILDAGFPGVNTKDPFQLLRTDNRIVLGTSYDFVFNTANVFQYDSHGTEVLSTLAAYQDPTFTGGAYKANFQLYVTEDVTSEYRIEEYNWLFAAERADSAGANIISTSLGYNEFDNPTMNYKKSDLDGKTAVITRAAQFAADRGMLVICSAGNEGTNSWQLITPPSDAVDVLAIANVNAQLQRSVSSSIGPSADQRVKPDLAALGTDVAVINPDGSIGHVSGTSLAAPLVTSLAAGVWQQYPALTNKEVIEVMKKTASQAKRPDNFLGYGIPNYTAIANYLAEPFDVYPNPFVNAISVSPKISNEISACRFQCIALNGQVVADHYIDFSWLNPVYLADLSSLSTGMYFVRLWFNNSVYVFKVAKR